MWGGTTKPGDRRRKAAVHSGPAEGRNRRIRILRRVELRRPEPELTFRPECLRSCRT